MSKAERLHIYPIAAEDRDRARRVVGAGFDVGARPTGENRCPRAGEWFLSGALVEAYQATADLRQEYAIAELMRGTAVSRIDWTPAT